MKTERKAGEGSRIAVGAATTFTLPVPALGGPKAGGTRCPVYGVPGRRSLQTRHMLMKRRRDAGGGSTTVVMISSIEKLILYRVANRQQGTQAELFGQRDDAI